jgi:hypothetical protein
MDEKKSGFSSALIFERLLVPRHSSRSSDLQSNLEQRKNVDGCGFNCKDCGLKPQKATERSWMVT